MKRLYYIFGLSALLLSSCNYFEYDNYEAPNSGFCKVTPSPGADA